MRKNIILTLVIPLTFLFAIKVDLCFSQERVVERLYVATDRLSYISGESLWLSMYCTDVSKEKIRLSSLSNTAYIEIHNSEGVVLTSKVALIGGRGSAKLDLPLTLYTGNYVLIAYTKQMLNEDKVCYFDKVISVYNTLSAKRVRGNVEIAGVEKSANPINYIDQPSLLPNENTMVVSLNSGIPSVPLVTNSTFPITLKNLSKEAATFNLSVVRIDSLPNAPQKNIDKYYQLNNTSTKGIKFNNRYTPEYEGEIIRGKVTFEGKESIRDRIVFLSASGPKSDIYTSLIGPEGDISFFTNSIYGKREIAIEVPNIDSTSSITFDIEEPFYKPKVDNIPKLTFHQNIESILTKRSMEMQIGRVFGVDTLYERMIVKNDPLIKNNPKVYYLDDYTRFPVMQEVITEYVSELRFRKVDKKTDLQLKWEDSFNTITYSKDNTLVLIDGIPVFDHKRIQDYDPLKVKSISIFANKFYIGLASFEGIALFQTYKGDYPGFVFNKNVRIMDYQGVNYPVRFTAKELRSKNNMPDLRSLLYWDPQIELSADEEKQVIIQAPSYPGTFAVTVEGISLKGVPFFNKIEIVVK